mgnify:CR=1 FL=1
MTLSPETLLLARQALQGELSIAEDNLGRAQMQLKADSTRMIYTAVSIRDLVASYQRRCDEVKAALEELK